MNIRNHIMQCDCGTEIDPSARIDVLTPLCGEKPRTKVFEKTVAQCAKIPIFTLVSRLALVLRLLASPRARRVKIARLLLQRNLLSMLAFLFYMGRRKLAHDNSISSIHVNFCEEDEVRGSLRHLRLLALRAWLQPTSWG